MQFLKLLILSLFTTVLWACTAQPEKQLTNIDEKYCLDQEFKKSLIFTIAQKQPIQEGIHLMGTVEGNTDNQVAFKSLVNGVVSKVNFALGQTVQKGQVLAEIKSTEFSVLRAELQGLESQIKVALANLTAAKSMFADGLASQKELHEAQSELDILQAQKAKVASWQSLYSASSTKDVFQIKAPASGVITQKTISVGMQISADEAEPLFTLANLDDVWVMANIYASNTTNIEEGMEVEIRTVSYPDEVFKGRIAMLPQVLDENSKVLKARIVLSNLDYKLKPGMLADIIAFKNSKKEAIGIPIGDVIFSNNEPYVVVYKSDCELEARKIEVLTKNSQTIYIKHGLEEYEKVIHKNQLLVFNRLLNH